MTTYRNSMGVLAVASNAGCVVVWGQQVAIYPTVDEARATVGELEVCKVSEVEADWLSRRIGEAEQRMKRVMWG